MKTNELKTIQDMVVLSARERPGKAWLKEKSGKEIAEKTFGQMMEDTLRISNWLKGQGGGVIHAALLGSSSIAYITALLGCVVNGHVAVPIDPQLSAEEIMDNLNRADVTELFYDKRFQPLVESMKSTCPQIRSYVCLSPGEGVCSLDEILRDNEPAELVPVDPHQCACILYTSGTTGKSKGVMLSHANLVDNATCCDNEGSENDILLTVLPIHHAYCLTCDVLLSLRYGATLCINDSLIRLVPNISLFKPTKILMVPLMVETIYRRIMAEKKKNPLLPMKLIGRKVFGKDLGVIFCGGAYLSPELTKAYEKMGIPLLQGYGMTECSPRIASSSQADPTTGEDVGRVVKNCRVKIEDGEILVKSPSVMLGYYKNEAATKEMFTEDGWLKTGDLGYEKDQRIYITGRRKNLIILSNGENISPEELENRFAGSEWMSEIMVYSENEQITAEVYPFPEYAAKAETLFRKKVEEINKSVPPVKRILRLRLRDTEFEKTTSRKVKRSQSGPKGRLL
ncbi:MAG TPA: long-chain fatty acid--CoA ligase, partial [Lachnospiraceae bacterium]|nr:long-chain fatty acid--CoA ligase [Lachnospiraceae bacterium]